MVMTPEGLTTALIQNLSQNRPERTRRLRAHPDAKIDAFWRRPTEPAPRELFRAKLTCSHSDPLSSCAAGELGLRSSALECASGLRSGSDASEFRRGSRSHARH